MSHEVRELRHYCVVSGRAEDLKRRFRDAALPAFERAGIAIEGPWQSLENPDDFYYIAVFRSEEHRERAWGAFRDDEVWQSAKAESEKDGPMLAHHESTLLSAIQ